MPNTTPTTASLPDQPGSPSALIAALAQLAQQQFTTEQELVSYVLDTVAEQLQVRTPLLSSTLANRYEILDLVNNQGCNLEAGLITPLEEAYCGTVTRSGQPLVIEDIRSDPVYGPMKVTKTANVGAYIGVPIRFSNGQTVGTLCGMDPETRTFTREQLGFLEVVARVMVVLLENGVGLVSTEGAKVSLPGPSEPLQSAERLNRSDPNEILLLGSTRESRQPLKETFQHAGFIVRELTTPLSHVLLEDLFPGSEQSLLIWVAGDPVQESLALLRFYFKQPVAKAALVFFLPKAYSASIALAAYQAGATRCYPYSINPHVLLEQVQLIAK